MSTEIEIPRRAEVAVVGAGPVGLLLAGELAAAGIRTVVLEGAEAPSTIPKANGIVGSAALALASRGILDGTGLQVTSPPRFKFGPLDLELGAGPQNPLHILPVPQRRLEELLEDRATANGARVHHGHQVIGFAQDDDGVSVEVLAGTRTIVLRAEHLVGCDGGRSLVRKHAGIGFPGHTSDEISRIARVTIPADRVARVGDGLDIVGIGHVAAMRPNLLAGGTFSIAPVSALDPAAPSDLYLISTHEPRGEAESNESMPVDELRASLRRVLGADLPFTEASAVRSTVANSRQADAYRVGRVFVAGDAAHLLGAGGSALNVGIHDALDLAGRLIAVLRDGASADALDAYEATRRPAGERALHQTRVQAALARDDDTGSALREVFGELITTGTAARDLARLLENG